MPVADAVPNIAIELAERSDPGLRCAPSGLRDAAAYWRIDFPPYAQQAGKPVVDLDRGGRVMTARTTAVVETWSTGRSSLNDAGIIGSAPSANVFSKWTSRRRFDRASIAPFSAGNSTPSASTACRDRRSTSTAAKPASPAARPTTITCCARPTTTGRSCRTVTRRGCAPWISSCWIPGAAMNSILR